MDLKDFIRRVFDPLDMEGCFDYVGGIDSPVGRVSRSHHLGILNGAADLFNRERARLDADNAFEFSMRMGKARRAAEEQEKVLELCRMAGRSSRSLEEHREQRERDEKLMRLFSTSPKEKDE